MCPKHLLFFVYVQAFFVCSLASSFLEFIAPTRTQLICPTVATSDNLSPHVLNRGNCVNDRLVAVYHNTTVNYVVPKNDTPTTTEPPQVLESTIEITKQPIATFDEWTKEKLKQEQRRSEQVAVPIGVGTVSNTATKSDANSAAARNYASRECGAKVLTANPEAENTKAVLNDKEKDEYMRNPCEKAPHKHFIVELCETIQPHTIELGNFELFSSGPREVRISASERFPTAEWSTVTEVVAQDTRSIQTFNVQKRGVYAKFLKVELLSHYGREHYCTLTVLRVLGMSMVDEYEAEAEMAAGRLPLQATESVDSVEKTLEKEPNVTPTLEIVPPTELLPPIESVPLEKTEKDVETPIPVQKVIGIVEKVVTGRIIKDIINVFTPGTERKSSLLTASEMCVQCAVNGSIRNKETKFCHYFFPRPKFGKIDKRIIVKSAPKSFRRRTTIDRMRRRKQSYVQSWIINIEADNGTTKKVVEKVVDEKISEVRTEESGDMQHPESAQKPVASLPKEIHVLSEQISNKKAHSYSVVDQIVKKEEAENAETSAPHASTQQFTDALPAPSISHKESVFMKLNKRIAALELNMSLSSEYLSELSRQYVSQAEAQKENIERAKRIAEEAVFNATAKINETIFQQVQSMRGEVEQLSEFLAKLRAETASIKPLIEISDASASDTRSIKHYSPAEDDLWTTEQVVHVVVAVQIFSIILVVGLQWCCQKRQHISDILTLPEVEQLIERKIDELKQSSIVTDANSNLPTHVATDKNKKRKKNKKQKLEIMGWERESFLPTPTPTPNHSDTSNGSDRRRESAHDTEMLMESSELEFPSQTVLMTPLPA